MRNIISVSLFTFVVGCGAVQHVPTTPPPVEVVNMEETHFVPHRGENGALEIQSFDAESLFMHATDLLNHQQCAEAVVLYDRVVREFPASGYVSPALYNSGLCLEEAGDLEGSAQHFRDLISKIPDNLDVKHAHFMLSNVLIRLEHWDEAIAVATELLAREDLDSDERVEAMARRAQAYFGAHKYDEAEHESRATITYFRTRPEGEAASDDFYIAAANFVLSEVISIRANSIEIPQGTTEEQHDVLERRARLVLNAQSEYFNTMRYGNAHWSGAAGYRVGALYDAFWTAIDRAPAPPRPDLTRENYGFFSEQYRKSLRELIRPLLQHAVRYWEMTLMMMERTGIHSEWEARIRNDLGRVRARMADVSEANVTAPSEAPPPPPAPAATSATVQDAPPTTPAAQPTIPSS